MGRSGMCVCVCAGEEGCHAKLKALVPAAFRTLTLRHVRGRVFQLHVAREFPCALPLGDSWLSLEAQHGQLVNFYPLDRHRLSPGFDVPGLNTYHIPPEHPMMLSRNN